MRWGIGVRLLLFRYSFCCLLDACAGDLRVARVCVAKRKAQFLGALLGGSHRVVSGEFQQFLEIGLGYTDPFYESVAESSKRTFEIYFTPLEQVRHGPLVCAWCSTNRQLQRDSELQEESS